MSFVAFMLEIVTMPRHQHHHHHHHRPFPRFECFNENARQQISHAMPKLRAYFQCVSLSFVCFNTVAASAFCPRCYLCRSHFYSITVYVCVCHCAVMRTVIHSIDTSREVNYVRINVLNKI